MEIIKPKEFLQENPIVSVVIPMFSGTKSPNYQRLIQELSSQSLRNFEVIISAGTSPNGRARNEGVTQAKGKFLVFIDETIYLTSPLTLEKLITPLEKDPKLGVTGTACEAFPKLNWLQAQYFSSRGFRIPPVKENLLEGKVQHGCMAIPQIVFKQIGWESDRLMTGTDNDLFARLKRFGYSKIRIADVFVYYEPVKTLQQMIKKSYYKGIGSAFAVLLYPGIFELSEKFKIRGAFLTAFYKFFSLLIKTIKLMFIFKPIVFICELFITFGFIAGCMKYGKLQPDTLRTDLRANVCN